MSEPTDPSWVEQIMMTMKEAGVRRFKLDGLEVEFEGNLGPDSAAPQVEYVQVPVEQPVNTPSTPTPRHGYAALFKGDMPKFDKPKA